jgi:hypothetical protein
MVNLSTKQMILYSVIGGVATIIHSLPSSFVGTNGATLNTFLTPANKTFWLRMQTTDNIVRCEIWNNTDYPNGPDEYGDAEFTMLHNLADDSSTIQQAHGTGVWGYVGLRTVITPADWKIGSFKVVGITPSDVYISARKNATLGRKEEQKDASYRRTFLLSMRASDRRFFSKYKEKATVGPSISTLGLGRFYTKTYPFVYDQLLTTTQDLGVLEYSSTSIFNRGNANGRAVFRIIGPITDPIVVNETTGERFTISGTIVASDYIDFDTFTGMVKYQNGTFAHSIVGDDSEDITIVPGINEFALLVGGYDTGAGMIIVAESAWK